MTPAWLTFLKKVWAPRTTSRFDRMRRDADLLTRSWGCSQTMLFGSYENHCKSSYRAGRPRSC